MDGTATDKGRADTRRSLVVLEAAMLAAAVVLLWLSTLASYLLFHAVAETVFIAAAVAVFVMAWNLRGITPNGYAMVMGTGLVFASALQLVHALAYKGMGVFPEAGADLPTQLWIAARYLTAATFVAAPFFFGRSPRVWLTTAVFAAVTAVLFASIFWWKVFPACYVEPEGLTAFKKASEYVIAGAFVAAGVLVVTRGRELTAAARTQLLAATLASAAAEIAFTLYVGVYTFPNMLGHLLMFVSVYLVYRGVVTSGMARTYRQVVEELEARTTELERLSQGLESRVVARTRDLEQALSEVEMISYAVSHELRSPLRAIDGFSLMALEEGRDVLSAETVDGLERSRAAAQHMGLLIDELLAVMKIGLAKLDRSRVDVSAVATGIVEDLRRQDPERLVTVRVAPGMRALADATLLRVILQNGLSNAWKFTARQDAGHVEVWSEPVDGTTRFSIRDDGVGFDDAQAGRVFEPFERLVRQDEFPGTGVGLAIVRRAVRMHGGDVSIEGAPGRGATLRFTLEPGTDRGDRNAT